MYGPNPRTSTSGREKKDDSQKLPRLWHVPTDMDVAAMLVDSQASIGRFFELPWSPENQDRLLILSVIADHDGDPLWTLKESTLSSKSVIWQHRTIDVALIQSFLVGEATGEVNNAIASRNESELTGTFFLPSAAESQQVEAIKSGSPRKMSSASTDNADNYAVLQGDIAKVRLTTVLQSIQLGKMSGRLAIRSESSSADIYFLDGDAQHASDGVETGDEVILDLIQLTSGKFKFLPDETSPQKTVNQKLDRLLLEAITLLDQNEHLKNRGLGQNSYLIVNNPEISLPEFMSAVEKGAPVDIELQKRIFKDIGEFKSLSELLRLRPLRRSQWVPVIFNLVNLDLVTISETPPEKKNSNNKSEKILEEEPDIDSLAGVLLPLCRPTGLLAYPAFQYFIALECARFKAHKIPVALIVISICNRKTNQVPDVVTIQAIFKHASKATNPTDIKGHFQTFDFAILLSNTEARTAAAIAQRIQENVCKAKFPANVPGSELDLAFGIAALPEDGDSMPALLSGAITANKQARRSDTKIVLYQTISAGL